MVHFDITSVLHVDLCLTLSLNFVQISNGHLVTKTNTWPQSVPLCKCIGLVWNGYCTRAWSTELLKSEKKTIYII